MPAIAKLTIGTGRMYGGASWIPGVVTLPALAVSADTAELE